MTESSWAKDLALGNQALLSLSGLANPPPTVLRVRAAFKDVALTEQWERKRVIWTVAETKPMCARLKKKKIWEGWKFTQHLVANSPRQPYTRLCLLNPLLTNLEWSASSLSLLASGYGGQFVPASSWWASQDIKVSGLGEIDIHGGNPELANDLHVCGRVAPVLGVVWTANRVEGSPENASCFNTCEKLHEGSIAKRREWMWLCCRMSHLGSSMPPMPNYS